MEVEFTEKAETQLQYWKNTGHSSILKRIRKLLESISETPFDGLGKLEPLKYNLSGYWSRRITDEHRLVYKISENKIIVIQCRFHY